MLEVMDMTTYLPNKLIKESLAKLVAMGMPFKAVDFAETVEFLDI